MIDSIVYDSDQFNYLISFADSKIEMEEYMDNSSDISPTESRDFSTTDWMTSDSWMTTDSMTTYWMFNDTTQRTIVGALLIFIGVFGLIGNAIVIIAFILSERLQNITNVFVINLAVSDLLSSTLAPFFVQNILSEKRDDILPKKLCAMVGILVYVFVSSSIVNHAVIAINRYCSISRPVSVYRKLFSTRRIVIMIVFIWTYSSVIPLVTHLSGYIEFGYNSKYRICSLDVNKKEALLVASIRALVVDVVCLVIVVIFYSKIFLFIKRHSNELMYLYSTERKGSDSSTIQRSYDDNENTRKASTMTRIVSVEDIGVETVLANPKPVWRQVSRTASESTIAPNGISNGSFREEIEEEGDVFTDKPRGVDENETKTSIVDENVSEGSDATEKKQRSNLSAISENSELKNVPIANNVSDDIEHSLSSEGTHAESAERKNQPISVVNGDPKNNNNEAGSNVNGRKERYSPSGSPSHSSSTINRRKISALVRRSFFGRRSSESSTSERIRCMQVRLNRRQIQITKNLFVVVCAFLICVSQYAVFLVIPALDRVLPYSAVLLTLSHAINPLIYAIKHPTFKVVIWPMVTCNLSKIPAPSRVLKAILRK